jgi:2-polyprenyl-6-hydroxyphenyl methylase / 3-demethylubiquinone-9 3-methyltransferase
MMADVSTEQGKRAVEVHSEQAGLFAERYGQEDPYSSVFAYSRKRLDELLDDYLPPTGAGLRLLDVGCGTGHQLLRWRSYGYVVAGVDGSDEMLAHARNNNPDAELREADARELPFDDASFDRVTSIEVLRYLPDPHRSIEEMARVLRPGGICLATAAPLLALNGYAVVNRAAVALPIGNLTRLKQFFTTSGRLRRQFHDAGFSDVTVHGVYIGPLIWIERIAPKRLSGALHRWERIDAVLADRPVLRDLSNTFLISAVRGTAA